MNTKPSTFKLVALIAFGLLLAGCQTIAIHSLNKIKLTEWAVQGDQLYLMGPLNSQSLTQFQSLIEEHPKITTLVLTASSGSLDDETTFKLGRKIRTLGLRTKLLSNSVVASGAVDLFLSGKSRVIEHGAKLGVHSWSDGRIQASDLPASHPDHQLNAAYIQTMLGDDAFYWFTIQAADADDIYWMTDAETLSNELVDQFTPASNETTPFGMRFDERAKEILEESN